MSIRVLVADLAKRLAKLLFSSEKRFWRKYMLNREILKCGSEEDSQIDPKIQEKLLDFLRHLSEQWKQGEKRWKCALFLCPETIVLQTVQAVVGPEIRDLSLAAEFLQLDFLLLQTLKASKDSEERIVAFPLIVSGLQSVWFQLFWSLEQQSRALSGDQCSVELQSVDQLRRFVCRQASPRPGIVTEHEARDLLLPGGPYSTYLGTVAVCWNNAMIRSICPFCSEMFKPSWGLWAFLETDKGGALCFDCWSKGERIEPIPEQV